MVKEISKKQSLTGDELIDCFESVRGFIQIEIFQKILRKSENEARDLFKSGGIRNFNDSVQQKLINEMIRRGVDCFE